MKALQSLSIVTLIALGAGCTARNTQPDIYRGNNTPQFTPTPDSFPGPASSDPILEAPGSTNSGGPTLLSPEPDLGPKARRRPPVKQVRTDPWGRPSRRKPQVQQTIRRQVRHRTLWQSNYQSSGGRPIQTVQLGIGHLRVLVLSSLRGTDPASITVIDQLAEAMTNRADLQNACTALFIRNPNPDGVALQSPYNGRGIDLTRNFPTEDWRRSADGKAGPTAGSEIETRVLIRLIDDFKPDRVVVIQNSSRGSAIYYAGPARQLARKVAESNQYQVSALPASRTGSLEQFAGQDRRLPVVLLAIDRRLNGQSAWTTHSECLKIAMTYTRSELHPDTSPGRPSPSEPVAETQSHPLPLSHINGPGADAPQKSKRLTAPRPSRRKYYELPPPGGR